MSRDTNPRLSHQALRILRLFVEQPSLSLAGSDVAKETGLMSGTIYPVLARLERAQWLESEWETLEPSDVGRPRKRFYCLTDLGKRKATDALAELSFGLDTRGDGQKASARHGKASRKPQDNKPRRHRG